MIYARSNLEGKAQQGWEVDIPDLKKVSTRSHRCCKVQTEIFGPRCLVVLVALLACSGLFGFLDLFGRLGLLCLQTKVTQEVN